MNQYKNSVLVIGFNTRPLATSLNSAGYKVFVVDFFGDKDLFPFIQDSLILTREFGSNYEVMKGIYHGYLVELSLRLLDKYPKIEFLIIGSGLDDAFENRIKFTRELEDKHYPIQNLNNDISTLKKARDIQTLYKLLEKNDYAPPRTIDATDFNFQHPKFKYPIILKKKQSSGGVNVHKVDSYQDYLFLKNTLKIEFKSENWLVQEYIDGLPISCTVISDGSNARVVSINRQILGEKFLNAPKEFMYCGNITPANLLKEDNEQIKKFSLFLTKALKLKGINGFDYVLKNHYPYLMEINPRIPGSLRVSEEALGINLMDLHIKSFMKGKWNDVIRLLTKNKTDKYATKLVYFASQMINASQIKEINKLQYVHDKTNPDHEIYKHEPVCTILYTGSSFADSYFGALKIVDKIERLIKK